MYLSKPIYEKLPFVYLIIGLYLFFKFDLVASNISAFVLYWAAALVWIKRSDSRRLTRIKQTVQSVRMPQMFYEFLPFFFIAISLIIVKYVTHPLILGIALLLALIALKNLYLRHQSRLHPLRFGKNQIDKL